MCGKLFNGLIWKCINWGRNLLCYELSILHRRKTLVSKEHMKNVMCVDHREYIGTKFFLNFVGGKTSDGASL